MNLYIIVMVVLYVGSYTLYLALSHGLGHRAEFLQARRFIPCAILPILPCMLASFPLSSPLFLSSFFVGVLWMVTYPGLYYITYRTISSDFGFHLDFVFGMYLIAWLISAKLLILHFSLQPLLLVVSLAEVFFVLIPLTEMAYCFLYGRCISETGMLLVLETDYNESIEYFHSLPVKKLVLWLTLVLTAVSSIFITNSVFATSVTIHPSYALFTVILIFLFLTYYLFKKKKGVLIRTGLVELYLDAKEYLLTGRQYIEQLQARIANLHVSSDLSPFAKPATFILVIGESESRDYMSAFREFEDNGKKYDTTPWLRHKKDDPHFILFPNTYSVAANTVFAVSRAVTEYNQYNDLAFYNSCSIIDMARKLGFTTCWYSNQGHLGSADTPVSLVAGTADTAKWTMQSLNTIRYDESLLEYLKEVDPTKNNFIVLHLKGSHFNYINRYPKSFTKWGTPGKYELNLNYYNSILYTDHILKSIFEYASDHLNLQGMVYFSDHAAKPDNHRSPDFDGFASLRIPLFTYLSEEYIQKNPEVYQTLRSHENHYFTNDLIYELLCGILKIKSDRYDETCSLASPKYKFTREMLKVNLGQTPVIDDTTPSE